MEVYVNSEKIEVVLENEKTIGEILRAFEEEFTKNNATTVEIVLDGKKIDADSFDEAISQPIEENTKLELTFVSKDEILQNLQDESGACRVIAQQLSNLPADFQGGRDKQANLLIATLAELVNRVCKTIKISSLFPQDFAWLLSGKIGDKNLADFFQELIPILQDFEGAFNDGDTVLLGDLAEYEIQPRLVAIADAIDSIQSN